MNDRLTEELNRLRKIRDVDNWSPVRSSKHFTRSTVSTCTGCRTVWIPQDNNHNKDLQSSRSVGLGGVESIDDLGAGYDTGMSLTHTDIIRIKELEEITTILNNIAPQENLPQFQINGMCEIGFRYPRLMNVYKEKYNIPVIGYDVSTLAVEFGKSKGFDTRECDINTDDIDLSQANLIVMYHVLEHLPDPPGTLKKIFNEMTHYSMVQFEVPIELDKPQQDFGHLFGFHPGDLVTYMTHAGFSIIGQTTKNIGVDAVYIERVTGIKL